MRYQDTPGSRTMSIRIAHATFIYSPSSGLGGLEQYLHLQLVEKQKRSMHIFVFSKHQTAHYSIAN
jgi:hypothetical protein